MVKESMRRMRDLGIPEEFVSKFESIGIPYCTDAEGNDMPLTNSDLANIEKLEGYGCKVFLVNHKNMYGAMMDTYLVTSKEPEDWDSEFSKVSDKHFYAYAFVMSELTHGLFDGGTVTMLAENGKVNRIMNSELF